MCNKMSISKKIADLVCSHDDHKWRHSQEENKNCLDILRHLSISLLAAENKSEILHLLDSLLDRTEAFEQDLMSMLDWDYQQLWADTPCARNRAANLPKNLMCFILSYHGAREWALLKAVNQYWYHLLSSPFHLHSMSSAVISRLHMRQERLSLNLGVSSLADGELRFASRHYSETASDWILLFFSSPRDCEFLCWNPLEQKTRLHSFSVKDCFEEKEFTTVRQDHIVQSGPSVVILLLLSKEMGENRSFSTLAFLQLHESIGHEAEEEAKEEEADAETSNLYPYSQLMTFPGSTASGILSAASCDNQVFLYQRVNCRPVLSRWSWAFYKDLLSDMLDDGNFPTDLSDLQTKSVHALSDEDTLSFEVSSDQVEKGTILFVSDTRILLLDQRNRGALLRFRVFRTPGYEDDDCSWGSSFSVELAEGEERRVIACKNIIGVLGSHCWRFYTYQGSCIREDFPPAFKMPIMDVSLVDDAFVNTHVVLYVLHTDHNVSVLDLEYRTK